MRIKRAGDRQRFTITIGHVFFALSSFLELVSEDSPASVKDWMGESLFLSSKVCHRRRCRNAKTLKRNNNICLLMNPIFTRYESAWRVKALMHLEPLPANRCTSLRRRHEVRNLRHMEFRVELFLAGYRVRVSFSF